MLVLLFDDDCLVCNRSIQFLLARDQGVFKFAALKSEYGQQVVVKHQLQHVDSVIFVEHEKVYTHSTAVLRALRYVPRWRVLSILRLVPRFIRDIVYNYITSNRHHLPMKGQCLFLTKEQRTRFLS